MTTVVLTGASGLCGRAIARQLDYLAAVRLVTTSRRALPGRHVVHDLQQPLPISDHFGFPGRADVVIHAAAEVDERSQDGTLFERNVRSSANVATYAREAGARQLIHLSSVSVYGPASGRARFDERSEPAPATPYARSKLRSEEVLAERSGSAVTQLRLAYVLGPGLSKNTIIRRFEEKLRAGDTIQLLNADESRLQFVAASDVARICVELLTSNSEASINLAGEERPSIREILKGIQICIDAGDTRISERRDEAAIHDVDYDGSGARKLVPGFSYLPFSAALAEALK